MMITTTTTTIFLKPNKITAIAFLIISIITMCLLTCTSGFIIIETRQRTIMKSTNPRYNDDSFYCIYSSSSSSPSSSTLFLSNDSNNNSNNNDDNVDEQTLQQSSKIVQAVKTTSVPLASFLLVAITVRSFIQLITLPTEIPGAFFFSFFFANNNNPAVGIDYLGTAFDIFFVGFGIQNILRQNGININEINANVNNNNSNNNNNNNSNETTPSLANLECRVTLNIGRERGTMMETEWAASGGRFLLPINLRFTDQPTKIDFPGEEALGGRFCYRLDVLDACVSFIGPEGEVKVNVDSGCWTTLPITEQKNTKDGRSKLRFFLDLPDGAKRNDVVIPPGRIFFSGVCFINPNNSNAPLDDSKFLVTGPKNVGIINNGGITIKKNGILNLYGALGDTNAILGRYKVDKVKIRDE